MILHSTGYRKTKEIAPPTDFLPTASWVILYLLSPTSDLLLSPQPTRPLKHFQRTYKVWCTTFDQFGTQSDWLLFNWYQYSGRVACSDPDQRKPPQPCCCPPVRERQEGLPSHGCEIKSWTSPAQSPVLLGCFRNGTLFPIKCTTFDQSHKDPVQMHLLGNRVLFGMQPAFW
jgi:hypothetical protein